MDVFDLDIDAIAERWIYSQLVNVPGLVDMVGLNTATDPPSPQIYMDEVPFDGVPIDPDTGRVKPAVVYQNQSGGTLGENNLRGDFVWGVTLYVVKASGDKADLDSLSRINQMCYQALARGSGAVDEGYVHNCAFEQTVKGRPELINTRIYISRGCLYRITLQRPWA